MRPKPLTPTCQVFVKSLLLISRKGLHVNVHDSDFSKQMLSEVPAYLPNGVMFVNPADLYNPIASG